MKLNGIRFFHHASAGKRRIYC